MPVDRFFIDTPFHMQTLVTLSDEEAHHLLKVTRKRVNENIELVNGQDELAKGMIKQIDKKSVHIAIVRVEKREAQVTPLILAQALPQLHRLELILEKGTELGVSEFWLFPAVRSSKSAISTHQQERLNRILINALKQCGRLDLPKILFKPPLSEWKVEEMPSSYFGSTQANAPAFSREWTKEKRSCFLVGPEGGFSEEEHEELERLGARGVTLHPYILRTETAAIVALSLMTCGL